MTPLIAEDVAAVAVVVPARDEQALVVACLRSVLTALATVARPGLLTTTVLVTHHCTDITGSLARQTLGRRGLVVADDSAHVAGARRAGVARALAHLRQLDPTIEPRSVWLLSTDADTVVPPGWVAALLAHTGQSDRAVAVAGLAELDRWSHGEPAGNAYRRLIRAGIDGDRHRHAYAANLAVRADAYLDVGGWPAVANGEDHALLAALAAAGHPVRRPTDVVVTTSGRRIARAAGGLGDLIGRLADVPQESSA